MNAEEIRRALFPHEETIKRLQAEIETLRARVKELENERNSTKDDGHGADSISTKSSKGVKSQTKRDLTDS